MLKKGDDFLGKNDRIRFSLDEAKDVNIIIYDTKGKQIWKKDLSSKDTRVGINYITWEAKDEKGERVGNGVYILKIATDGKIITKKIAVIR